MDDSACFSLADRQQFLMAHWVGMSQWNHVTQMIRGGVMPWNLVYVIHKAVMENQWTCVVDIARVCPSVELRNYIVSHILRCRQWQCVLQVVDLGVSSERIEAVFWDAAVSGQWDCVMHVMKLGVSLTSRNIVFPFAVWSGKATCSAYLIQLGLSLYQKKIEFRGAILRGQVGFLVELAKICNDPVTTDLILTEALVLGQLQIVLKFVQLSEQVCLHVPQKKRFIHWAIQHDRFDVYVAMSGNNADDSDIQRDFTDAMRSKNRDVFYRIVHRSKRTVALFKEFCARQNWGGVGYPTDNIEWICETLKEKGDVYVALQVAISCNIFCNQETFTACVADSTISKKERLARLHKLCFIASRRKMAASVEDMIADAAEELIIQSVCKRRTLFLMVVRYGLFEAATEVYRRSMKVSDVKFAIRMALASGKNPHLKSFCELAGRQHADMLCRFTVRNALQEFMQDCTSKVKLERFLCVYKAYCQRRNASRAFLVRMLRKAVKAAVKTKSLILFVTTCDGFLECESGEWEDCGLNSCCNRMIIQRAFGVIVKNKQYDMTVCAAKQVGSEYKILWGFQILTFSIKAAFKQKAWTLLHRLIHEATPRRSWSMDGRLDEYRLFLACAKKSLGEAEVMKGDGAAALEDWLKTMHAEGEEESRKARYWSPIKDFMRISWRDFFGSLRLNRDESLPAWCHDNACPYLAMVLALGQANWNLLERVVSEHHGSFTPLLLLGLFVSLFDYYDFNTVGSLAITLLRPVPVDREMLRFEGFSVHPKSKFQQLLSALKEAKEYGWVMVFSINNDLWTDWSDLHKMMSKCKDEATVDYVIERAADIRQLHRVKKFLPKCCNPAVLHKVLKSAVEYGDVGMVRSVANLVDLSSPDRANALINRVCYLSTDASFDMVAQCLVNAGLSTTQRCREKPDGEAFDCPLVQAYRRGKVQSVKLFHRSGLCSNHRLFAIKRDTLINPCSDYGAGKTEIEAGRSEIREYLKHAACSPLSLQELCRQSVSHSVGCRPGRQERIQALPVPQSIKLFLRFPEADFTTLSVPRSIETLQESSGVYLSLDSD